MRNLLITTHGGKPHTDDVCGVATVGLAVTIGILPYSGYEIQRVRNTNSKQTYKSGIAIDVGRIFDPENDRFDHHQEDFDGVRENGVPYASFGLVWKKYGEEICQYFIDTYYSQLQYELDAREVMDSFDERLVQPIDNADVNGKEGEMFGMRDYTIQRIVRSYDYNGKSHDKTFVEDLVPLFMNIIRNEIRKKIENSHDAKTVRVVLEEGNTFCEGRALFLPRKLPFKRELAETDVEVVVYSEAGQWRALVTAEPSGMNKVLFPKEWRGLAKDEFEVASGVVDANFCHRAGFTIGASTKDAIVELVSLALNE